MYSNSNSKFHGQTPKLTIKIYVCNRELDTNDKTIIDITWKVIHSL